MKAALFGLVLIGCAGATAETETTQKQASTVLPGHVDALDQACLAPHGPALVPTTVGDFDTQLAGRWYRCDAPAGTPITVAGQGIELAPNDATHGNYWGLGFADNGDVTREDGLDNQGGYGFHVITQVLPVSPSTTLEETPSMTTDDEETKLASVVEPGYVPTGFVVPTAHRFDFETSPRRMRMDGEIWFVAVE